MLKVTDDSQVTLLEAATLLGLSHKRIDAWQRGGKFRKVGYRATVESITKRANNLYRLGDIRKVSEGIVSDPRQLDPPAGHMKVGEAATRLGITPTVASAWFDRGRLTGVTQGINSRCKARFPSEESVVKLAAAMALADKGQSNQAKGDAAAELANTAPVLYGLLDAGDAAELERRLKRLTCA